jgi:hypothetical protein
MRSTSAMRPAAITGRAQSADKGAGQIRYSDLNDAELADLIPIRDESELAELFEKGSAF